MNSLTVIAIVIGFILALAALLAVFVAARDEMRQRARAEIEAEREWRQPLVIREAQEARRRQIVDLAVSEWRRVS